VALDQRTRVAILRSAAAIDEFLAAVPEAALDNQ
jgi:hypothetical protein